MRWIQGFSNPRIRFLWFSLVEDVTRGEYNVLSKNVTRDVSQSEKTLSEVI